MIVRQLLPRKYCTIQHAPRIEPRLIDESRFALAAYRENLNLRVYVLSPSSRTGSAEVSAHCQMWNQSMRSFREPGSRPRESSMAVVGSYAADGIAALVLNKNHDGGTSEGSTFI